jgi:hypothetical protein
MRINCGLTKKTVFYKLAVEKSKNLYLLIHTYFYVIFDYISAFKVLIHISTAPTTITTIKDYLLFY